MAALTQAQLDAVIAQVNTNTANFIAELKAQPVLDGDALQSAVDAQTAAVVPVA